MRLDIGSASFSDSRLPASGSRLLNGFAVPRQQEEGQEGPYLVQGTPGMSPVATMDAPCYGLATMGGKLVGLFGDRLVYDVLGARTTLGVLPGVTMAQFALDRAGLVGLRNGQLRLIKTGGVVSAFALPAGEAQPSSVAELDNYTIYSVSGGDKMLASVPVDPSNVDALNFATGESRPDNIVRVAVSKLALWVMQTDSIELFYNAGISGFPFARYQNAMMEIGLLSADSVVTINNAIYWLGHTRKIYRGEDLSAEPVSPPWLNRMLATATDAQLSACYALGYSNGGFDFYAFTIPDTVDGPGFTVEYNGHTKLWHHRRSPNMTTWSARGVAYLSGSYYVGSSVDGVVSRLTTDGATEFNVPIPRQIITPPFGPKQDKTILNYVDVGLNPSTSANPGTYQLSYSDDDCRTFSTPRDMPFPRVGHARSIARNLGQFRRRQLKLDYAGFAPWRVEELYIGMASGWPKRPYTPGQGGGQKQGE